MNQQEQKSVNQKEQEVARQEKQKELAIAFQRLFASENGNLVLDEISRMCNENKPTYVDQNPNGSAYREGQRSIILGIRSQLNKTFNQIVQENAKL